MSDANVDVELFIEEVRIRPVIWDVNHEDYKDRLKKQCAWEEVCQALVKNFSQYTKNGKHSTIKKLALKWKNLKDNYSRSVRKKEKEPAKARRPYIYARQMLFLQVSMDLTASQSNLDITDCDDSPQSQFQQRGGTGLFLPETISPAAEVTSTPGFTSSSSATKQEIERKSPLEPLDEDKAFFDSLIPTIKSFNDDQKLDFRSEVIDVIKRIKSQHKSDCQSTRFPFQTCHLMFPMCHPVSGSFPSHLINVPVSQNNHSSTSTIMGDTTFAAVPTTSSASHWYTKTSPESLRQPTNTTD